MDNENRPIPNKMQMLGESPTARKALITLTHDAWSSFLSAAQKKKRSFAPVERQELLLQIGQEMNLFFPVDQVELMK